MHRTPTRVTPDAWSLRSRHQSRHGWVPVIADVSKQYARFYYFIYLRLGSGFSCVCGWRIFHGKAALP